MPLFILILLLNLLADYMHRHDGRKVDISPSNVSDYQINKSVLSLPFLKFTFCKLSICSYTEVTLLKCKPK